MKKKITELIKEAERADLIFHLMHNKDLTHSQRVDLFTDILRNHGNVLTFKFNTEKISNILSSFDQVYSIYRPIHYFDRFCDLLNTNKFPF